VVSTYNRTWTPARALHTVGCKFIIAEDLRDVWVKRAHPAPHLDLATKIERGLLAFRSALAVDERERILVRDYTARGGDRRATPQA
jgi:hypothetical protein